MNKDLVIWKIESYCKLKGIKPTVACQESGAGRNFLGELKRGSVPGVERFEALARYLGVSVSQIIGDEKEPDGQPAAEPPDPLDDLLTDLLRRADPETKRAMIVLLQQKQRRE